MGLPPALVARLKKRGLLALNHGEKPAAVQIQDDEEVIAESYDTPQIHDEHLDEFGFLLPPKWEKVFEQKYATYYYWDTISNRVSWVPPSDPDAKHLHPDDVGSKALRGESEEEVVNSPPRDLALPTPREHRRHHNNSSSRRHESSKSSSRKRANKDNDAFDPMDPSSYSDAPKGKWNSGMKKSDDAKTGVDSTANGPLFQQRPYPSPGEVLSRNKKARREQRETGPHRPGK